MAYPNLSEIIKYHPYHIGTFANFADVTTELLQAALDGQEELTGEELRNIARYSAIPLGVLKCRQVVMMDRSRMRHKEMIDNLIGSLSYIWNEQKMGSKEADIFMKYHRVELVNLELAFLDNRASYAQYLGAKERVDQVISFIRNEKRKPRALTRDAV
ncbi:MAG: hypothetical protein ACLSCA_02040 [[Clostridium] symbiosum]